MIYRRTIEEMHMWFSSSVGSHYQRNVAFFIVACFPRCGSTRKHRLDWKMTSDRHSTVLTIRTPRLVPCSKLLEPMPPLRSYECSTVPPHCRVSTTRELCLSSVTSTAIGIVPLSTSEPRLSFLAEERRDADGECGEEDGVDPMSWSIYMNLYPLNYHFFSIFCSYRYFFILHNCFT